MFSYKKHNISKTKTYSFNKHVTYRNITYEDWPYICFNIFMTFSKEIEMNTSEGKKRVRIVLASGGCDTSGSYK